MDNKWILNQETVLYGQFIITTLNTPTHTHTHTFPFLVEEHLFIFAR